MVYSASFDELIQFPSVKW